MGSALAILAGRGQLPLEVARAQPQAVFVTFAGVSGVVVPSEQQGQHINARFEQLGALFADLHARGVKQLVFAGAMARPSLDPSLYDPETERLMPQLGAAMAQGDDALLRQVITTFEAEGFAVIAADEVVPGLLPAKGVIGRAPDKAEQVDADRALAILAALAAEDVAQGAVVEAGLCLGIETLQGTDAMLRFVAETAPELRRAMGVFVKTTKLGQERRVDMPSIGPDTIRHVAAAKLAGLVVNAGEVYVLELAEVTRLVDEFGLFLELR